VEERRGGGCAGTVAGARRWESVRAFRRERALNRISVGAYTLRCGTGFSMRSSLGRHALVVAQGSAYRNRIPRHF